VLSVFVCGAFMFQPILMKFFTLWLLMFPKFEGTKKGQHPTFWICISSPILIFFS